MKKRDYNVLILFVFAILLSGCSSVRAITMLQDMEYDAVYLAKPAPELVIKPGDCLAISVSSAEPELSFPFSLQTTGGTTPGSGNNVGHYTVDADGQITFPVLGQIPVQGKTIKGIVEDISGRISRLGYIKEPIVNVTLENFSVTVIGNAGNKLIPVESEYFNVLQAIALSGGVTPSCSISDVMVIRSQNGERRAYSLDLKSKDIFDSPAFYLQQNDVIYIKTKDATLSPSGQVAMSFVGTGVTVASIITNFLLWSKR